MRTEKDYEYERKRDALIPFAEAEANRVCGKNAKNFSGDNSLWYEFWNRTYFAAMDRMAKETGILTYE